MKRFLLWVGISLLTLLTLTACRSAQEKANDYRVVVIDGCQYLVVESSVSGASNYSFAITHKGNCNSQVHKP